MTTIAVSWQSHIPPPAIFNNTAEGVAIAAVQQSPVPEAETARTLCSRLLVHPNVQLSDASDPVSTHIALKWPSHLNIRFELRCPSCTRGCKTHRDLLYVKPIDLSKTMISTVKVMKIVEYLKKNHV